MERVTHSGLWPVSHLGTSQLLSPNPDSVGTRGQARLVVGVGNALQTSVPCCEGLTPVVCVGMASDGAWLGGDRRWERGPALSGASPADRNQSRACCLPGFPLLTLLGPFFLLS